MDQDIPLPPPVAIPLPPSDTHQLYSPSQNSPTAYSPSRATSPSSDTDEKNPSASRKTGTVLGKGQAKSRLRAFMQSQVSNSPKRRVASVFNEDDQDEGKKMRPVVKQATPVMDQLMKDELREKNKAIEIVQEANRKREDSLMEANRKREDDLKDSNRKREEDLKKIQDNKELDLREILKRKKERDTEKKEEESEKRSRSQGKERSPDRKRGRKSPERRKSPEGWRSPERRKSPDLKTPDAKRKRRSSGDKSKSSGEKDERRESRRSRTPEKGSRAARFEDKKDRRGGRSRTVEKQSPWPSLDNLNSIPWSWAGLKRNDIDVRNPQFRELMERCGEREAMERKVMRECEMVTVMMCTKEDFKQVHGKERGVSDTGNDIDKIEVPKKYIRQTSDGVMFSFNKATNEMQDERKYQQRYDYYEMMDKREMDEDEFENMRKILEGDKTPTRDLVEGVSAANQDGSVAWYPEEKQWRLEKRQTVDREEMRKLRSSVDEFVKELSMGADDVNRSVEKKPKKYIMTPEIAALKKQIKELENTSKKKKKKKLKSENDDGSAKKSKKKKKDKSKEKKEKKKKKKKEKKLKRSFEAEEQKASDENPELPLETDVFSEDHPHRKMSGNKGDSYEIDSPSPPMQNLDKQQAKLLSLAGYGGEPVDNDASFVKKREGSESPKRSRKSRKQSPIQELVDKNTEQRKSSISPNRNEANFRMIGEKEKKPTGSSRDVSPVDKHGRLIHDVNQESPKKKDATAALKLQDYPDYDVRPSSHNSRSEDSLLVGHLPAGTEDMSDSIDTSFGTPVRDEARVLKDEASKRSLLAESPRPASRAKRSLSPARPGGRGPRTPSPSPRLPKMTDRRSPSTSIAPVMRDQRSPVRRQGSPGWRNDAYSGGWTGSPKRSPKVGHISRSPMRPKSPGGRAISGKSPGSRDELSPGRSRRPVSPGGKRSPGISPGFGRSPGRSIASRSPVKATLDRSPGRPVNKSPGRARTPPGRSPSVGSRKRSPGRPFTPERRIPLSPGRGYRSPSPRNRRYSPGRKSPSPGRRPHSPGRRPPSPGKRPHSPGRRPPSPGRRAISPSRRQLSPGRRPLSPGRRPLSPGRRSVSPGRRSPGRRRSPSPQYRRRSPRRGRSPSPYTRRFRSPSPGRRYSPSRRRAPPSPGRGHVSPDRRPISPGRRPLSPGRRPLSPGRRSPARRPASPGRRPHSPGRRPLSPGRRPMSPGRRAISPGRPGWRPPSPGRRASPGRRHSPGRRPVSPGRRAPSPGRRGISPRGRPYSPDSRRPPSPGQGCPADSTISDADLATQMLPPSAAHHRSSHYHSTHADSPKRPSLDERLERELGIKVAREEPSMPDFRVPPPGFPGSAKGAAFATYGPQGIPAGQTPPRYGLPAGVAPPLGNTPPVRQGSALHIPATQPQTPSAKVALSTGLPAKIPTYNDSHSDKVESSTNRPPYPGTRSEQVAQEREQASKAAESVAAKLQEMQAAKEEERRKKREARMAERMAMMEPVTDVTKEDKIEAKGSKVASGPRILEALEKKEVEVKMDEDSRKKEEQEQKRESGILDFETPVKEKRNKKKGDPDTPTLITLKPFYRPESKKEKKKMKKVSPPAPTFPESPEGEEEFVKKEPVPLPDNSLCKPVLVKLGFPITRDQNGLTAAPRDKKLVKFVDGVLPGQGSPDINTDSPTAPTTDKEKEKTPTKKKWKKVTITVVTRVTGDTDSEDESPPPPPPGSPPRYHTSQLIQMYGKQNLLTPTKA